MCGIIGYVGSQETAPFLIQGLKRLEYRGYDSAGIAVLNSSDIKVLRRKGNLSYLEAAVDYSLYKGNVGVGHTRWATHGVPSEANAHPHLDCRQEIAVAHNGIIENFQELKDELQKRGHQFKSETDTEVIAHLIEEAEGNSLLAKVQKAVLKVKGSYALAVISKREPNCLIGVRKDSPLVVGLGKSLQYGVSHLMRGAQMGGYHWIWLSTEFQWFQKDANPRIVRYAWLLFHPIVLFEHLFLRQGQLPVIRPYLYRDAKQLGAFDS
jgi:glucosamine--fructose-6-phosphate aminotransferase (isomerizing)